MYNIGRPRFDLLYVVLYYYRHVSPSYPLYTRYTGCSNTVYTCDWTCTECAKIRDIEMCIDTFGVSRPKDYIHTSGVIRDRRLTYREKPYWQRYTTFSEIAWTNRDVYSLIKHEFNKDIGVVDFRVVDQKLAFVSIIKRVEIWDCCNGLS